MNKNGETNYIFTTEGHLLPIKLDFSQTNKNAKKKCELRFTQENYFKMQRNLPMKIKYFNQLFDLVGVGDNLDIFLERKSK